MAASCLASSAAALVREVDKAPGENDVPRQYNVRVTMNNCAVKHESIIIIIIIIITTETLESI